MAAFWDVTPCTLVEVYQRFRDAYYLHLRIDLSKSSVNSYQTTWRRNSKDNHFKITVNVIYFWFPFFILLGNILEKHE
jgi:hypothetical protein